MPTFINDVYTDVYYYYYYYYYYFHTKRVYKHFLTVTTSQAD